MNLGVEARCEALTCGPWKFGVFLAMYSLCDLPDSVHIELGVFAHQVQVPSVADEPRLGGLYSHRSVTFGFGCVETPAPSDHLATYISFAHQGRYLFILGDVLRRPYDRCEICDIACVTLVCTFL